MKHQCHIPIYNKRGVTIKTTTTKKKTTYKNMNILLSRIICCMGIASGWYY